MIYTVTLNPSLDYVVTVKDFQMGKTNRTATEELFPGGKGINVSMVLQNLGVENVALGIAAGFTGKEILRRLAKTGVKQEFFLSDVGSSRINVKLRDFDGTEINGRGPAPDEGAMQAFLRRLDILKEGDFLVLAGSIPEGVSTSLYRDMMKRLSGKGILFVVDTAGPALAAALEQKPFLVKPNRQELEEFFHVRVRSRQEAFAFAQKLQERGSRNVMVSLSQEGAILLTEQGARYSCLAPKGQTVNTVGAGDSCVAGFLAGFQRSGDYEEAFRMAVAAGSASAFSRELASREEIERLLGSLQVISL